MHPQATSESDSVRLGPSAHDDFPLVPNPEFTAAVRRLVVALRHEMEFSLLRDAYLRSSLPTLDEVCVSATEMAESARTIALLLNELIHLFDIE